MNKQQEADKILREGKISRDWVGNDREGWKVANVLIERRIFSEGDEFICTCKYSSIKPKSETDCSYIIALKKYLEEVSK